MSNVQLSQTIRQSKDLANWLGGLIDGLEFQASDRNRLAGACYHVGLKHHTAITGLIEHQQGASAFALIRPQVDSYVRGFWLAGAATDDEVSNVLAGNDPPSTPKLMARLEESNLLERDSLTSIADQMWGAVCDFTHTGSRMMILHITDGEIGPAWKDDELAAGIFAADAWAIMIGIGLAGLANDGGLAKQILDRGQDHFPHARAGREAHL